MAPVKLGQTMQGTYLQLLTAVGRLLLDFSRVVLLPHFGCYCWPRLFFSNCLHHMIERSSGNKCAAFWILENSQQVSCSFTESLLLLLSRPWTSLLWLLAPLPTLLLFAHPLLQVTRNDKITGRSRLLCPVLFRVNDTPSLSSRVYKIGNAVKMLST